MIKIRNSKRESLSHLKLEFGIYLGFGIWNLGFTKSYELLRAYLATLTEVVA